jgi:hypothetical protein
MAVPDEAKRRASAAIFSVMGAVIFGLINSSFTVSSPRRLSFLALMFATAVFGAGTADAGSTRQYCQRIGTDDTLRPIPPELVPQVNAAFGMQMSTGLVTRNSVFRCVDGSVMVCTLGANLPCGKAGTKRANEGAKVWCKDHPDSDFVPAFAAGHDTIYAWACHNGAPRIIRQISKVDSRGFIAQFWKQLDPR